MNKSFQNATTLYLTLFAAAAARADYSFSIIDYPGVSYSATFGTNDSHDLVGEYTDEFGVYHGYLLSNGDFETLDYPGSIGTSALDANTADSIVGVFGDFSGNTRAFKRIGGTYAELIPAAGSTFTKAGGINEAGHIVGSYYVGGVDSGYLYNGATYTPLNRPGASKTIAVGINNSGSIVGGYTIGAGLPHGYVLSGGTYTTLDYPGAAFTEALCINDSGQIAGDYKDSGGTIHGFFFSGGTYVTVDVPGGTFTQVRGITNDGILVGQFMDATGTHGFVATPELLGDFNGDGKVDAADYVFWRKSAGPATNYSLWRANFGQPGGSGTGTVTAELSSAVVPESSARTYAVVGISVVMFVPYLGSRRRRACAMVWSGTN